MRLAPSWLLYCQCSFVAEGLAGGGMSGFMEVRGVSGGAAHAAARLLPSPGLSLGGLPPGLPPLLSLSKLEVLTPLV